MDDATLKRKLAQFVKLGNELHGEAKLRYGPEGFLFHEAEGGVFLMSGDDNGTAGSRQEFIRESAKGIAHWGAGAW